jgi:competence protein ComEC
MIYFLSAESGFAKGEAWAVSLAAAFGTFACLAMERLPQANYLAWLAVVLLLARFRRPRVLAACCAGFFLAAHQAQENLSERLPGELDGTRVELEGRIDSLVNSEPGRIRFRVAVRHPQAGIPPRIQLSWYRNQVLPRAGEIWRLQVKLRSPRGLANPGGFDYERWLFRKGIGATGYVLRGQRQRGAESGAAEWLLSVQDAIYRELAARVPEGIQQELVFALVLGHKQGLHDSHRKILATTGTAHLLAISGLHIGLVSGLVFWLVRLAVGTCWPAASRQGECLAWLLCLAAALFYACLAGLALPTRRALLMLGLFALFKLMRLPLAGWRTWCLALGAVCVLDPLAVLGQDLWLSFGAVACIGLAMRGHRGQGHGRLGEWARMQLAITVGLAPLLAAQYGQISFLAPLVNLLLVPWFGVAVLPPLLLGVILLPIWPALANDIIQFQAQHLLILWQGLEWLSMLGAWQLADPGRLALALAVLGSALFLMPQGLPGKRMGLLCWAAVLFPSGSTLNPGEFELTVLDVGQGLASVIRTRDHLLVYDTGPAYMGNATASISLLPFLRSEGVNRIDGLVTSHSDLDHSGGREILRRSLETAWEMAGEQFEGATPCQAGSQWWWDGVHFQILHPLATSGLRGNDASCVLLVRGVRGSALLTGDIPRLMEELMVSRIQCLAVDLVVAPHHGSATSSSVALVKATSPAKVIFAAGHGNRWRFPADSVVDRWKSVGASGLVTSEIGAVTVRFSTSGQASFWLERLRHQRLWRARPVSSGSDVQYDSGSFPTRDVRNTCSKLSDPADG